MMEMKLQRMARVLHGVTLFLMVGLPLVLAGALIAVSMGVRFQTMPEGAAPEGIFLWLGVLAGFLPALALFWALETLRRLFQRYMHGDVLTEGSAVLIRQTGKALLALAALKIMVMPLQTLLFTWQSPPGQRMISVGIGHAEIGFLLVAGLLTVIGWAMTEAARQAEENRAFV